MGNGGSYTDKSLALKQDDDDFIKRQKCMMKRFGVPSELMNIICKFLFIYVLGFCDEMVISLLKCYFVQLNVVPLIK